MATVTRDVNKGLRPRWPNVRYLSSVPTVASDCEKSVFVKIDDGWKVVMEGHVSPVRRIKDSSARGRSKKRISQFPLESLING
jgi:hypothetical protein